MRVDRSKEVSRWSMTTHNELFIIQQAVVKLCRNAKLHFLSCFRAVSPRTKCVYKVVDVRGTSFGEWMGWHLLPLKSHTRFLLAVL